MSSVEKTIRRWFIISLVAFTIGGVAVWLALRTHGEGLTNLYVLIYMGSFSLALVSLIVVWANVGTRRAMQRNQPSNNVVSSRVNSEMKVIDSVSSGFLKIFLFSVVLIIVLAVLWIVLMYATGTKFMGNY